MTAVTGIPLTDLVEFLTARVEDDVRPLHGMQLSATPTRSPLGDLDSIARQRAECDVKQIVLIQVQCLLTVDSLPSQQIVRSTAARLLQAMALPHREHVDYRAHGTADPRQVRAQ